MNWTFVAVVAVLFVSGLIGYKRGFVKTIFSMLALWVAILLTFLLAPGITKLIAKNTSWDRAVRHQTEEFLMDQHVLKTADEDVDISETHLPDSIKEIIEDNSEKYINEGIEAYNDFVVDTVSEIVFKAICYFVIFLIIYVIIHILEVVLNIVSKLPVIKQINGAGGAAVGVLMGFFIVWMGCILLMMFSNTDLGKKICEDINDNQILKFVFDNNLINKMFLKI